MPSGLIAVTSVADAGIPKKIFASGTTSLILTNEEIEHIIKIVKSL